MKGSLNTNFIVERNFGYVSTRCSFRLDALVFFRAKVKLA